MSDSQTSIENGHSLRSDQQLTAVATTIQALHQRRVLPLAGCRPRTEAAHCRWR